MGSLVSLRARDSELMKDSRASPSESKQHFSRATNSRGPSKIFIATRLDSLPRTL